MVPGGGQVPVPRCCLCHAREIAGFGVFIPSPALRVRCDRLSRRELCPLRDVLGAGIPVAQAQVEAAISRPLMASSGRASSWRAPSGRPPKRPPRSSRKESPMTAMRRRASVPLPSLIHGCPREGSSGSWPGTAGRRPSGGSSCFAWPRTRRRATAPPTCPSSNRCSSRRDPAEGVAPKRPTATEAETAMRAVRPLPRPPRSCAVSERPHDLPAWFARREPAHRLERMRGQVW